MLTIGLFGTCGGSKWRQPFIEKYKSLGIPYFNPQVDDWKPECAVEEARHLAEDEIILFPVTGETAGLGSLSEVGFSILHALDLNDRRDIVVLIETKLSNAVTDKAERDASLRSRKLVAEHLKKLRLKNVYIVDTLEEMLEASILLYRAAEIKKPLEKFNPQNKE
jgi:hypothetical protein